MSEQLPPNIRAVTITDWDGKPHNYMIVLHAPDEGEALMWQLAAMAGESLGGLMASAISGTGMDSEIDFGAAGRDMANALKGNNMPQFRSL